MNDVLLAMVLPFIGIVAATGTYLVNRGKPSLFAQTMENVGLIRSGDLSAEWEEGEHSISVTLNTAKAMSEGGFEA